MWQSCALSLLVFTGASQFALVGVIASGGAPVLGAALRRCCSAPATPSTASRSPPARLARLAPGRRRAPAHRRVHGDVASPATTREHARVGFLSTGLSIFVLWNLATLAGALAGDALGDPRTYGLDAAVGGAFLALLWPRLDSPRNRVAAVLGGRRRPRRRAVHARPAFPVLAAAVVALLGDGADGPRRPSPRRCAMIWARGPRVRRGLLPAQAGRACRSRERVLEPTRSCGAPPTCCPSYCWPRWSPCRCSSCDGPDGLSSHRRPAGRAWRPPSSLLLLRAPFMVVVFVAALTAPCSALNRLRPSTVVRSTRDGLRTSRLEGRTRSPCAQHGLLVLGTPDTPWGRKGQDTATALHAAATVLHWVLPAP